MSFLDVKYIQLVSPRLSLFSRKKADLYNFRCPYCGDSQKRRNKARGYFFKIKNDFVYKCHNCGMGRTLANFLKDQDTHLYDQYVMEKFKEGKSGKGTTVPNPKFNFKEPKFVKRDTDLEKISSLNIIVPNLKSGQTNKRRLLTLSGKIVHVLLSHSKTKKVTYSDTKADRLLLRQKLDTSRSCLTRNNPRSLDRIFDNEPRNREIVARISKAISRGDKVVIWPKNIQQKDINDMFLAGHDVQTLVDCNVYQGLQATLKFNDWKKV